MNWTNIALLVYVIGYISLHHHIIQSYNTPLGNSMSIKERLYAVGHALIWPVGVSYFIYLNIKWENRRK